MDTDKETYLDRSKFLSLIFHRNVNPLALGPRVGLDPIRVALYTRRIAVHTQCEPKQLCCYLKSLADPT